MSPENAQSAVSSTLSPPPKGAKRAKVAKAAKAAKAEKVSTEAKAAAREYSQIMKGKPVKKRATKKRAAKKTPKTVAKKRATPKKRSTRSTLAARTTKALTKIPAISNKSKFVRDNPELSAKELVAKAKALGTKLRENYVYNIRGALKTKLKHKLAVSGSSGLGPSKTPLEAGGARGDRGPMTLEELFLMVVAELGTLKAVALLGSLRSVVQSALVRGA
jgi:hypothetical protein